MNEDKLKLFQTEEEVRSYAKVNGMDEGGITKTIAQWKSVVSKEPVIVKGSKKFGFMNRNAVETKD